MFDHPGNCCRLSHALSSQLHNLNMPIQQQSLQQQQQQQQQQRHHRHAQQTLETNQRVQAQAQQSPGVTAMDFLEASKCGNLARMRELELLMENGSRLVDVNQRYPQDGSTALYWAACNGHLMACDWLVRHGARVNLATEKSGSIPLHGAADRGHAECVRLLIRSGRHLINMRTTSNGDTPLHLAAYRGHLDVCRLLLSHGACADEVNNQGRTALDEARTKNHYDVFRLLCKRRPHGAEFHSPLTNSASTTCEIYPSPRSRSKRAEENDDNDDDDNWKMLTAPIRYPCTSLPDNYNSSSAGVSGGSSKSVSSHGLVGKFDPLSTQRITLPASSSSSSRLQSATSASYAKISIPTPSSSRLQHSHRPRHPDVNQSQPTDAAGSVMSYSTRRLTMGDLAMRHDDMLHPAGSRLAAAPQHDEGPGADEGVNRVLSLQHAGMEAVQTCLSSSLSSPRDYHFPAVEHHEGAEGGGRVSLTNLDCRGPLESDGKKESFDAERRRLAEVERHLDMLLTERAAWEERVASLERRNAALERQNSALERQNAALTAQVVVSAVRELKESSRELAAEYANEREQMAAAAELDLRRISAASAP